MNILLIDNYDSFTYNLAHILLEIPEVNLTIQKHDFLSLKDIRIFDKVILSPGPGLPKDNGLILEVVETYHASLPILGVCLGLQAIYEAFGGSLLNLPRVHHGVTSPVSILDKMDKLFTHIDSPFPAGRYHSWVCDPNTLPPELIITAVDDHGTVMACRHRIYPVHGIQFHPESILTPRGKKIIENFINLAVRENVLISGNKED